MQRPVVLISACLLGECVRYDGQSKPANLSELFALNPKIIPVCPECSGGLPVPRDPCEIQEGKTARDVWQGSARVVSVHRADCTQQYVSGSKKCHALAKDSDARLALLKEKSPACGSSLIHSGSFDGSLRSGRGVFAQLLVDNKLMVFSENELNLLIEEIKKSP